MRSIPTRETRTHASMTIPLSRTRSRTSIRLVPPAARSTGIELSFSRNGRLSSLQRRRRASPRQPGELPLQRAHLSAQFLVFRRLLPGREVMIELPPIKTDLLRLVDRTNQQTD